ncbi:hypothetical protein KQI41_02015 [Tissierella pigra]|uniref:hypothetical protein n=1 Tax=Tissierella pigra TaxID=2607614 RepID=UPI001C0F6B36|nr:hypothetical protein [Tissierella pigra]MBU5425174.1 hypothetical protein [Tissierella pigra]
MEELKVRLCNDIAMFFKKDIDLVLRNTDKSLFSEPFYLTAEELLYLYFHIKKNYNSSLTEEEILKGSFQNINSIYTLIL